MISADLVTLFYLIASVCFIQALKGLSHPTTSRRGEKMSLGYNTTEETFLVSSISVVRSYPWVVRISTGVSSVGRVSHR